MFSPQKKCSWTDLVVTDGLKKAPFNSHMQVFFQAFIQTHPQDEVSFQNQCLLTRVTVFMHEMGHCVHSLGAALYSVRDTVSTKLGRGETRGERKEGGKCGKELVKKRPEKQERNQQSRVAHYPSIAICLDSRVLCANRVILSKTVGSLSQLQFPHL